MDLDKLDRVDLQRLSAAVQQAMTCISAVERKGVVLVATITRLGDDFGFLLGPPPAVAEARRLTPPETIGGGSIAAPAAKAAPKPVTWLAGPWSDAEELELRRRVAAGEDLHTISRAMNRHYVGVTVKIRQVQAETAEIEPRASGADSAHNDKSGSGRGEPDALDPVPTTVSAGVTGRHGGSVGLRQETGVPARLSATGDSRERPAPQTIAPISMPGARPDGGSVPFTADMTLHQMVQWLSALPQAPGWTPARDLVLASALMAGDGTAAAGERLQIDRASVVARWKQLCPIVTRANQQRLVEALKARAGVAA